MHYSLNTTTSPEVDQPLIDSYIGYHVQSGNHAITLYDWQQFVRFADKYLK